MHNGKGAYRSFPTIFVVGYWKTNQTHEKRKKEKTLLTDQAIASLKNMILIFHYTSTKNATKLKEGNFLENWLRVLTFPWITKTKNLTDLGIFTFQTEEKRTHVWVKSSKEWVIAKAPISVRVQRRISSLLG